MSKIIGIDLGTTNSAVAFMEGGQPTIIENSEGNRTTPSVVAMSKSGERLVGVLAKRQSVVNPANTIYSAKRLIGRMFDDPATQKEKAMLPYEIRKGSDGGVEIKFGEKWVRPAEIAAMVLQKLKADAEAKLGETITGAVITVPAYFDDSQRKATKDAGAIAGLDVKRIINEPTAAALAYGLDKKKDEKIVVFDLGGGTFDVSILEVGADTIEVLGTHGDTHLGGDDFDQKIIEWIVQQFKSTDGIDLSKDSMALQRLKEAAERAKHELSSSSTTEINQPFITTGAEGPKHLVMTMTRAKLEEIVGEYIDRAIAITKEALAEAKLSVGDIQEVVLVGGQTRMPKIYEEVEKMFGKQPHKGINPDEVVAAGAAIQGGILAGDVKDILLLDVTPLTLGLETLGGVRTPLIEKNTTVPTKKSQTFSTAADNQTSVEIHVLQGEREMAQDNKSLGRFILDGIPPAPRGVPQVEVTFDIDANGILNVSAKDKASGKEQKIRIEGSSGIPKEEIERMQQEAQKHAEEDKKKKEAIETKNMGEQAVYMTEKALKEAGDKVDAETKKAVEEKVAALKTALSGTDSEAIKKATDELLAASQKIGEQMYKDSQAQAATPDAKPQEGEVVDVKPEEKK
ncbi:MAG: molecular chaperone DnaK [Candidatus Andersenbacteria bacterium RIFCSPHIGHO2_02_FULL_45_11]|uniref:Chaperone protein DnaK n=1 Tax=Candidatus Andersenbacteria bacterium RIFCSPHIGHO2_12_FULL_45_11 TaxID=1797281 RepID=A0A1G1X1Z0_9BACT|nr:MAG: molecular chaperone DnaK [Candidatus Andersenbacteria bacterium RIFCSPHIGHO2_01_FULL_46_36]OGY31903.1 MAG: molecular chaperone DnaK [Candidatus Andersenbacteria bacterium RIFCSPHIGHO2_02_FULL_45_11]OGY34026.1 MAG: molecular chaperone DnaK [Candidatus Andersenbacteria bacterium RIFCSPHIGHO2_12_FULL_45_11]